ncbi:peptide chain release factor N(5)-glutamine methyltransferase [Solicola gregarius]|uniref:Release factor glutamine methyltransferase n=1 Tax=Solicola gregarius TaxID=2908642 RepID=A0AA46TIZ1_9ACTN|nr:peptide chain release factor N(5)-glutamine methyltransferase [Solicola gregarius]UYM05988.1 peptide chain release factor N(5)-glutamine methyltransferase [Solicola gregarius]
MRVADLLASATQRLADAGVPSPDVDAELLLEHVLDVPRSALRRGRDPSPEQAAAYDDLVCRRATREPLQHLTGVAHFRHVELAVGPGVFVPRPETECVAGWAIEAAERSVPEPVVVDLCTGSGAIAAAVADELPAAHVHAVEVDPDAVAYAERNLAGSGVDLRHGDVADAFADLDDGVDVVVANPPYIPLEAYESVAAEARDHDPALALWSGDDGLDAIRVIERVAYRLLRPGGVVGVEHADVQGESAPGVFSASGRWADVRDNADLAGKPRYLTARRT